jgi:ribosomal protein L6P/L9E
LDLINNKNLFLYSIDLLVLNRYSYILKKCKSLDVYKGKGILVEGEKVIKKEGKKALY